MVLSASVPNVNPTSAESVLPTIQEMGCRVESAELTERRLYIKAVTERMTFEVKKGDRVLVSKYGGTEIKIDGKEYKIFNSDDLVAILE